MGLLPNSHPTSPSEKHHVEKDMGELITVLLDGLAQHDGVRFNREVLPVDIFSEFAHSLYSSGGSNLDLDLETRCIDVPATLTESRRHSASTGGDADVALYEHSPDSSRTAVKEKADKQADHIQDLHNSSLSVLSLAYAS